LFGILPSQVSIICQFVCVKMHLWTLQEVQSLADLASVCCCLPRCNHIRCWDLRDAGSMPADVSSISACHFNPEISALAFRYMSISSATMLQEIALSEWMNVHYADNCMRVVFRRIIRCQSWSIQRRQMRPQTQCQCINPVSCRCRRSIRRNIRHCSQ